METNKTESEELIEYLKETVSDMVSDLMYYDRKEDQILTRDNIEDVILEYGVDNLVEHFRQEIENSIK